MQRLLCFLSAHRWSSWQLRSLLRGLRLVDDYTQRTCQCCGHVQTAELRPAWQVTLSK